MADMYNEAMIEIKEFHDKNEWDTQVRTHGGHPLQLWGWGELKAAHGWQVERLSIHPDAVAQILIKKLPWPFHSLAYIPRGPVGKWSDNDFRLVADFIKRRYHAVCITLEPDSEVAPQLTGIRKASNSILLAQTLILDLTKTEADLQSAMAKKTRQYIRKSEREGIEIREAKTAGDVQACLEIYHDTARRAGFALHDDEYYRDVQTMLGIKHSPIFMAYKNKTLLAFVWLATSDTTAFELYGGMNDEGQRLRANYALKWHAIKQMKARGVLRYDVNGLLNDGISSFKTGFASHETTLAGSFDYPLTPVYPLWAQIVPLAKQTMQWLKSLRK